MNKKILLSIVFSVMFISAIISLPLEARHWRSGFGFGFGFSPAPTYAVPVAQPVYVAPCPNCYDQYVVYPAPAPVVVYPAVRPSFGFGMGFWR